MVIQTGVTHACEVFVVGLPLNGIPRQGMLTILQRQYILEDVDERLSGCQPLLAIQQEITNLAYPAFVSVLVSQIAENTR